MAEQYELDRKAKMTVLERESEERRRLIQSQRIAEDMRVLQIDTRGMEAADAAIINAQKARIRAAYLPPPNYWPIYSWPICGENDHFEACSDLDIERPTSDLEREEVFPEEYG
ncbi:hypothetical protein Tco_1471749 [Tanacetum coccineum]